MIHTNSQFLLIALTLVCAPCIAGEKSAPPEFTQQQDTSNETGRTNQADDSASLALANAPPAERRTITEFSADTAWPRRAIAAMRLQRYSCDVSASMLVTMLSDSNWRVRCFAIHCLAVRNQPQQESWFASESEPRVVRTLLRSGYRFSDERLLRGVEQSAHSSSLDDRLLAIEIAVASRNPDAIKLIDGSLSAVINRMTRAEAGAFSPRLATLTGAPDYRRPYLWQRWNLKFAKRTDLLEVSARRAPSLAADQFIALRDYLSTVRQRKLDLAILLDCTDSMHGQLAQVQGGLNELMLFLADVQSQARVAIVAYRDRREDFETRAIDFSTDIASVREQLWQLSTEGGGDSPEAVHPAMKLALDGLSWDTHNEKIMIIIGDAPPHVGLGTPCEQLAASANETGRLITHTVQADGKPVKHFPEIAKSGGGRCVTLQDQDSLIIQIAGLTMAEQFENEMREFFQLYLDLCR
jgi:Mg-chelatase subunit ChlD